MNGTADDYHGTIDYYACTAEVVKRVAEARVCKSQLVTACGNDGLVLPFPGRNKELWDVGALLQAC